MTCDRVVVVLALACAAVAWHQSCEARDGAAALMRMRAAADSLAAARVRDSVEYARQHAADRDALHAQAGVVRRQAAALARVQAQTDTLLDTLVLVGDTAGVRRLIEGERAQARELIDTLTAQRDWAYGRMAYWRDTALTAKDQQLVVSQRLLRAALAIKRPRTSCGPSVVAGYGTRGFGVTAGYGCTLRL